MIHLKVKHPEYIPLNVGCSRCLKVEIYTNETFPHDISLESLDEYVKILSSSLEQIFIVYENEYVFHQPVLSFRPDDKKLILNVYMLSKKRWDAMCAEKELLINGNN